MSLQWTHLLLVAVVTNYYQVLAVDKSCFNDPNLKPARRTRCPDSLFTIHDVRLTGLYNTRLQRHPFFKGDKVKMCISGTAHGISTAPAALQTSIHGTIHPSAIPLIGGLLPKELKVNNAFCEGDFNPNTCLGMSPPCRPQEAISPGQDFCFCTAITVPSYSPELDDVTTTIRILGVNDTPGPRDCELVYENDKVRQKGKSVLACIRIPTMIRDQWKKPAAAGR